MMLRIPNATALLRRTPVSSVAAPKLTAMAACSMRTESTNAISNPTLANIEKRWPAMPPREQADLWMALRDRMRGSWHDLTFHEKKAAYWIAFGPHGPREPPPPGEGWKVFWYTTFGVGLGVVIFFIIRLFAKPPPHTMTKEWQEASNEYLKKQKAEPITGWSSPKYTGKGMVQSPPEQKD